MAFARSVIQRRAATATTASRTGMSQRAASRAGAVDSAMTAPPGSVRMSASSEIRTRSTSKKAGRRSSTPISRRHPSASKVAAARNGNSASAIHGPLSRTTSTILAG